MIMYIIITDEPDAPMNVRIPVEDITSESFVVQWDAVTDFFAVSYTIRWYGEDGMNGTATVNGLSYTVTGLTNSTSYNVTVHANNTCCGAGPVSNVIMTMTNNRPPIPPSTSSTTPGNRIIAYVLMFVVFNKLIKITFDSLKLVRKPSITDHDNDGNDDLGGCYRFRKSFV